MNREANVLVLDEPTNHLDIESKEVLEDALMSFQGTILFISHDRYFINKLSTKVVEMTAHGSHTYSGNYTTYLDHKNEVKVEKEKTLHILNKRKVSQRLVNNKIKSKRLKNKFLNLN